MKPLDKQSEAPMRDDAHLETIRTKLFHGLLDYTKSFPDFSIPQRFSLARPNETPGLLERIRASLTEEKEILLYIHLPFCFSECVFCNAFPHKLDQDLQRRYLECLTKEIEIYSLSGIFDGRKAKCIYIGGGTPTTFSAASIGRILDSVASCIEFTDDCNITSEAHPKGLIEANRLEELADLGINRLSIGCQTFEPNVLALCNRSNSRTQVEEVIFKAKDLGLSTNIDMMIGLPGQTLLGVKADLDLLTHIAPDSIEYMRHEIVNPRAMSLYRDRPDLLVGDEELFWMTLHAQRWMEQQGYEQNGCFTGERHFPYRYHWLQEMPFIALGSRSRSHTKTVCYDKHEDLALYLQLADRGVAPIARYVTLSKQEQMYRSLLLGLQVERGLDLGTFEKRFGNDARDVFARVVGRLNEYGCVTNSESAIKLSREGRYFVEDVCCFIIDDAVGTGDYGGQCRRMPHSAGDLFNALWSRRGVQEGT